MPAYEIISGATIAFAAILLIIPGFATDIFGLLLIFPLTRRLILGRLVNKIKTKTREDEPYIEGEFEEDEKDNDRKI